MIVYGRSCASLRSTSIEIVNHIADHYSAVVIEVLSPLHPRASLVEGPKRDGRQRRKVFETELGKC